MINKNLTTRCTTAAAHVVKSQWYAGTFSTYRGITPVGLMVARILKEGNTWKH